MAQTVSDQLIQRLYAWGVRTIYGYPGDGINGLVGAIARADGRVRFVQTRHEEIAAFMACAHAKFTGEVGVCMATSGPGAIHLLNGLYDAQMDHQPVVAIVGQSARTAIGSDYQQEVDLTSLFKDVAHHYVHECNHPAAARHQIDRALRIAAAERAVTCVIVPHDVQELDAIETPPREHDTALSGIGYHRGVVVPAAYDLHAAAEILNAGERVAILVGAGALRAQDEVRAIADMLGAGVAKALLGKAVLPDDLPFVTGAIGLLGTEPSDQLMEHCDTLLMIGSSFPYSEFLPKPGKARGVQIDLSPRMLSLRYPMDVSLHGDAAQTLRALMPLLDRKPDHRWRARIAEWNERWWKMMEERAFASARPINPQRVFWELSSRLPDDAILTADSGSCAGWWARDLKIRTGMMASLSGNLATMGPAMPYAVAAKLAYPGRPVIAAVGDGAMQMIGNSVLVTIAAHYREWRDPRLVAIVLNNGDLNQVTWEQRVMVGDPRFAASQDLPRFPYARYAQILGLGGLEVERPEQIAPALDQALAAELPVVVECHVDPEVPPLPPHVTFKQARNFLSSIAHGDAHRWRMVAQSARQVWAGMTK
ncbi:MAG TPA: thiamine pyrophosphate-requiring protein [Kofleriaceae bacterium]|nr:thiamine pyrophosphate-requiring protein [Kofleriaceae bacterium]